MLRLSREKHPYPNNSKLTCILANQTCIDEHFCQNSSSTIPKLLLFYKLVKV